MHGLRPVGTGEVQLREATAGPMTALLPYRGTEGALSETLKVAHGLSWPGTGRMTGTPDRGVLWFGRQQALLIGVPPDAALGEHAALVDQTDAWAVVDMAGAGCGDVLARLTPIDLRDGVFETGHTARTQLGHMAASVTRTGRQAYRLMVFRSMARTLLHELTLALEGVAARGGR